MCDTHLNILNVSSNLDVVQKLKSNENGWRSVKDVLYATRFWYYQKITQIWYNAIFYQESHK